MCALVCRLRLCKQLEVQAGKSPFRFGSFGFQVSSTTADETWAAVAGPGIFRQARFPDFRIETRVTGINTLAVARGIWTGYAARNHAALVFFLRELRRFEPHEPKASEDTIDCAEIWQD